MVQSEGRGKGCTFVITFRRTRKQTARANLKGGEPRRARAESASLGGRSRRHSVLMKAVLETRAHEVVWRGLCGGALKAARNDRFDVLLCDLGFRMAAAWILSAACRRSLPYPPRLPVSAGGGIQRSKAAGFDVHLTKPVDIDQWSG